MSRRRRITRWSGRWTNIVRPDKDELHLTSVIIIPEKEPVCLRIRRLGSDAPVFSHA